MKEYDVGAIPVVRGSHAVGIITDRDLVVRGLANRKPGSATVQEVMTTDLITATPDTSVEEAAQIMSENQIRRLLVVEEGNLVGIVALKDLTDHGSTSQFANHAIQEISETKGEHLRELH
jgi:CBS domain-containing protein